MHGTIPKLSAKPPAALRAVARERRQTARRPVTHIALPGYEVARDTPRPRESIAGFLRRTGWAARRQGHWRFRNGLPTICTVNGEPMLRRDWKRRIGARDQVQFISRPLGGQNGGGTGKQVIGLVALIAVVAFAAWAPGALLGLSGWMATATTAAIGIGGSLLINAITGPKAGATNDPAATTDQIYTASASGNLAKLGQPLPIGYGREKVYPDFAATPWGEFVGNDQYQNILLSVGLGRYQYEALYVDDTVMWTPADGVAEAFSSATVEFYDPNQNVTLFPVAVASSSEVSGQQLPHGTGSSGSGGGGIGNPGGGGTTPGSWLGGYAANAPSTVTYQIAIDFVFPAGCFRVSGSTNVPLAVSLRAEYRAINNAGAPTGGWNLLFEEARTYNSRAPIRDSIVAAVPEGRYEVRFRRNDGVPDSNSGASDVVWAGLRAYLRGQSAFPVSTIAIRIKGTESTQGSFKFGALRTRILPVWNGSTFVELPTRNGVWAFLDAASNASYGAGQPLAKVDFQSLVTQAAAWDARGDHFDYTFASAVAAPEAFDKILTPGRCRHFWLGDTISIVRDEWRDVPTMLLTDREIVRDSLSAEVVMLGEEDPDAVILEYVDEETWRPAQVQYPPEVSGAGGFHATSAETKRVDGILNRNHAYREAAFYYLQSIYRRENVQLSTEYEGRAITFGSVVRVSSDTPLYGQSGGVVSRSGNSLTLSPAPVWSTGSQYIRLRRRNGKFFGPILVTKGSSDAIAVLDAGSLATAVSAQGITLSQVLARADGGEDPSFDFGAADKSSRLCVVLSGQPNGSQCTLNLVVDDPRVHATDLGTPPVLPTPVYPTNLNAPLIIGLNATFEQAVMEPRLSASWFPAAGAFYYVAEVSYDNGNAWLQVYEGQDNKFEAIVTAAALTFRVQAVGKMRGPWSQVDLPAPTITTPALSVALSSLTEGLRNQVTQVMNDIAERVSSVEQLIASVSANQDGRNWKDKKEVRFQLSTRIGATFSEISRVEQVMVSQDAALATAIQTVSTVAGNAAAQSATNASALSTLSSSFSQYQTTVSATYATQGSLNSLSATVTTTSQAVATLQEQVAASWGVSLDVNGFIAGIRLVNGGSTLSAFQVIADAFQVASPGVAGGALIPVFGISTVNGAAKIVLRGDMYGDGSIYTRHMTAGSINTLQLAVNSVPIEAIIDGAVTNSDGATRGSAAANVAHAKSVVTRNGRAFVVASIQPTFGGGSGTATAILRIDGVERTRGSASAPVTYAGWNGAGVDVNYGTPAPISLCVWATGLADGAHSFSIECDVGTTQASIAITNPRR